MGTQACKDYKIQVQKSQNSSILSFFSKASEASKLKIPSTTVAPVRAGGILGEAAALHPIPWSTKRTQDARPSNTILPEPLQPDDITFPTTRQPFVVHDLASKLQELISNLPPLTGMETGPDPLETFMVNPAMIDNPSVSSDSLWEEILNGMFKGALGWGTSLDVGNVVENGRAGLDGMVRFIEYFVRERGVSEALIEGKLAHLMDGLKLLYVL